MKSNRTRLVALAIVLALAVAIWHERHRIHFDWHVFGQQLRMADWRRIAIALACIYAGYLVRSIRWVWLVRHKKKLSLFSLLGTQVMGFTAVALIGRVADLVRPYLVAKKTGLPLSEQIAVYVVERLFDAGSMALWGDAVAKLSNRAFGVVSKRAGEAVEEKIHAFHSGLDTIRSVGDFAVVAGSSLGMWVLIALSYLETMLAFVASPVLSAMTPAKAVLMMVVSGGASVIPLPVVGWFIQIGEVAHHHGPAGEEATS